MTPLDDDDRAYDAATQDPPVRTPDGDDLHDCIASDAARVRHHWHAQAAHREPAFRLGLDSEVPF
jgi:hypothetical protein